VKKVPQYCYQCVAGPDLLTVKVEDGTLEVELIPRVDNPKVSALEIEAAPR
jgi:phenylacetyl-CoA:acceptor oxidoreductase